MNQPVALEAVIAIAQQAGQLVRKMRREGLQNIKSKSSEIDLVTEADLASEVYLREALSQLYPAADFWGEESNQAPTSEFYWLVDPIDGTVNYANGLDYYSVTVALCQGDQPLLGVTVEPANGRVYAAQAGQGAFQREASGEQHPLTTNTVAQLRRAFLTTGFPYHRTEQADNNTAEFEAFIRHSQGVRCLGSAALDLANVASGALAGYWEAWLNPWDTAAGVLFVREAGGHVSDYAGSIWTFASRSLVASNGQAELHDAMLTQIAQARATLTNALV